MAARIILGVIIGGILGCIATGAGVALFGGGDFVGFITAWGKYGVSIAIAILLPVIFLATGRLSAMILGIIALDLVASAVTMWVFDGPDWSVLLGFNAIYAVVATIVYAVIAGPHRRAA